MNKRLPLLLSLLGLILLAASLAYWILQLYQPPQRPLAAVQQGALPDPALDNAATLFGGQLAVASATNYQLTGVVSAGNDSVAILVADGTPPKALKVGHELAPGVKLAEVHPRYVMLSDGGVMKRVDLATDTKPAAPMGAPGMPGAVPGQQVVQPNFPQPQQMPATPAVQSVPATGGAAPQEPPMAPGAVQAQPSMTNPGDVGAHDNAPPANPNSINPPPNQPQMPPQMRGAEQGVPTATQ